MGTESLAGGEYWDFLIDAPMAEWHQAGPQSRRAPAGFLREGEMGDVSHPCLALPPAGHPYPAPEGAHATRQHDKQ